MTPKLPVMLERIRQCEFCGAEVKSSPLSYEQNPYCTRCLDKRLAEAVGAAKYFAWTGSGDYLRLIDLGQQRPQ